MPLQNSTHNSITTALFSIKTPLLTLHKKSKRLIFNLAMLNTHIFKIIIFSFWFIHQNANVLSTHFNYATNPINTPDDPIQPNVETIKWCTIMTAINAGTDDHTHTQEAFLSYAERMRSNNTTDEAMCYYENALGISHNENTIITLMNIYYEKGCQNITDNPLYALRYFQKAFDISKRIKSQTTQTQSLLQQITLQQHNARTLAKENFDIYLIKIQSRFRGFLGRKKVETFKNESLARLENAKRITAQYMKDRLFIMLPKNLQKAGYTQESTEQAHNILKEALDNGRITKEAVVDFLKEADLSKEEDATKLEKTLFVVSVMKQNVADMTNPFTTAIQTRQFRYNTKILIK